MLFDAASRRPGHWLLASLIVAAACGHDVSAPASQAAPNPTVPSYGKTQTGLSISSVSPDTGSLSTTVDVQISGSGFADGMVASWQLSGVADPTQIKTNSTKFVSGNKLVANITISGKATAAKWDVAIYSGGKTGLGSELGVIKQAFEVLDPTATWTFPLSDAGLSVQSDHLFSDGTNSVYANGVCNLAAKIFATTQFSNSGDATMNTGSSKSGVKCTRRLRFVFPDGYSETVGAFNNLREIENTAYSIPVGSTVLRQLHLGTDQPGTNSRCNGLVFGYGARANVGAGSDSIWVTRVDPRTWHAYSQAPPHNLAWCKNTGQLYPMTVDLTVISNRPLP